MVLVGRGIDAVALKMTTGKQVWHDRSCGKQPLILSEENKTFINQSGNVYDLLTGKMAGEAVR